MMMMMMLMMMMMRWKLATWWIQAL
jgi:hypothetical protein